MHAIGVCIPGKIEPVSPPPFAIVGRSQQPIHEVFVGMGIFIMKEMRGLFRRDGIALVERV